ncbi:unnamed protein product [Brachionus calyciflorus]|uniref:Phytanoyl-CoA dioxygenase n=1 Tax=Brachionus calyciflorus TaxID=104777 RepID=A0A813QNU8_9BILA|nr:unnamed protein product [Brachionus calyciflorus]
MYTDFFPETDISNLNATLNQHGVCVLTNVFQREECDFIRQRILNHLKTELNVSEPNDFEKLKPLKGGIMRYYGISLLKEVLDLKTDARTVKPFEEIWQNNELTTSFDSIFIGPPPEQTEKDNFFDPNKTWFHLDQASNKHDLCCVQAFINLEDAEHGDGCLSVLEKSHLYFNEFYTHFGINTQGRDWFLLNQKIHVDWFREKGCNWRTIMAPKGSMVFWDSRVVHQGTLPRKNRPNPKWRFLSYVCYTPGYLQSKNDAKLKREAYVNNLCTAHWPYTVKIFNVKTDDFNKTNNLKELSQRQKLLFGI